MTALRTCRFCARRTREKGRSPQRCNKPSRMTQWPSAAAPSIPKLATKYHVVAPDYPGFGYSDYPSEAEFGYTFDHLASVTDDLLNALKLERYSIYVQDYGSPVGFRLFVKHPGEIQAIIDQNGNAYNEGLSPFWAEYPLGSPKRKSLDGKRSSAMVCTVSS